MANYYLHREGENHGPYTKEDMKQFLADGQVGPEEMVCEEGGSQWVSASTLAKPSAPKLVVPAAGQRTAQSRRPAATEPPDRQLAITPEMIEAADDKVKFALKGIVISIAAPAALFAAHMDKPDGARITGRHSGLKMLAVELADFYPLAILLGIIGVVFFSISFSKARKVSKALKDMLANLQTR